MAHDQDKHESEFDLRSRADLCLAYEPGQPPASLLRDTSLLSRGNVRRSIAALLFLGIGTGFVLEMRPPELVRDAIEHEYYESTLRGSFMEARPLLKQMGLDQTKAVPGSPQLMRPCDIDGHLVYHLTTFFEKGGMVTVFAFDRKVALNEGSGWWRNVHWRVVTSREGKPLVMVAQQKKALAVAEASFAKPPA
jgi:hypothetical protein